jgi:hypothetical protein
MIVYRFLLSISSRIASIVVRIELHLLTLNDKIVLTVCGTHSSQLPDFGISLIYISLLAQQLRLTIH